MHRSRILVPWSSCLASRCDWVSLDEFANSARKQFQWHVQHVHCAVEHRLKFLETDRQPLWRENSLFSTTAENHFTGVGGGNAFLIPPSSPSILEMYLFWRNMEDILFEMMMMQNTSCRRTLAKVYLAENKWMQQFIGCLTKLSKETLRSNLTILGVDIAVVERWSAEYKGKSLVSGAGKERKGRADQNEVSTSRWNWMVKVFTKNLSAPDIFSIVHAIHFQCTISYPGGGKWFAELSRLI